MQNAVAAARGLAEREQGRLRPASTSGNLVLDADTRLAASNGHAVNFRQVFDGLEAAEGGLVTVGITGSAAKGWRVAYVSSRSRATRSRPGDRALARPRAGARGASRW